MIKKHQMPLKSFMSLLVLNAGLVCAAPSDSNKVELDGYQFNFELNKEIDKNIDVEKQSRILVTRGNVKTPILFENTNLIPGCGKNPALQKLGNNYVAACGNLGGRHYTYKIFRIAASGLESATLDAFDNANELTVEADGSLSILVTLRDQFPGELNGPAYFPYVYKLVANNVTFGFERQFGADAKKQYENYYSWLKSSNKNDPNSLPLKIAALIATQDKEFVCHEINAIRKGGDVKDSETLEKALDHWIKALPKIGYPLFNLKDC